MACVFHTQCSYTVLAIALASLSIAIIGVHFVTSTGGYNMVCDALRMPGVPKGEFELQYYDMCSTLAQKLRDKLPEVDTRTWNTEWEKADYDKYRNMATSKWYLHIIELDSKVK